MSLPLPERFRSLMLERNLTVATAESATAGLLSAYIASVSGASKYHAGGVVTYNIDQKVNLLSVDREDAEKVDCVSKEIAIQMARGVRKLCGTDIGLSVTGYAEPPGGQSVPHIYAWLGFSIDREHWAVRIGYPEMSRVEAQTGYAEDALLHIVNFLERHRPLFH